jgi:hypothetical protein
MLQMKYWGNNPVSKLNPSHVWRRHNETDWRTDLTLNRTRP